MNANSYIQKLLDSNVLRGVILDEMVAALKLPQGSRGLDAGCGIGLQCLSLAESVGPTGQVVGLDISAEMLDYGRKMVKEAGMSERISFQEGNVSRLPFDNNTFDWVWSVDCVGYAPLEPVALLKELVRIVKPGGIVAIAAWSSEKLLPGYPRLEARLGATKSGIAPFMHRKNPGLHFLRALNWFHELGLNESRARTFVDSVHAPLDDRVRKALESLFQMRWPDVASELSSDDLREFQHLCLADSPDFILNSPDYYAFFTYTMFSGRVAD